MPSSHNADRGDSIRLHKTPRAHLIGIAGAGMRSLADVMHATGWEVNGSDLNAEPYFGAHFNVARGHDPRRIDGELDLVVYSDAVPDTNAELARARELHVEAVSYPQMLGRMMTQKNGLAVAGTHGKSTCSAMAAEILVAAGFDPTVIYGASPMDGTSGGRHGRSRWMLAEACEYRSNFLQLTPQIAVLLGIELDHFDCFQTPGELEQAFAAFAHQVPAEGLVLAHTECAATERAVAGLESTVESFGFTSRSTWHATAMRERRGYHSCQIRCQERLVCDVKLRVAGRHNVLNALAAAALASHCGAPGSVIRIGLERFAGLRRRMEIVGESRDYVVIDDYAHHPTEITATLTTVRQMYPGRRISCVFQPHQVSRTEFLLEEFAQSLQIADRIIVAEIYRAREAAASAGEVTAADLAARAGALGADARYLASAIEIKKHLNGSLQAGDVLVTLGAGDIGIIADDIGKGLRTLRQAG